MALGASALSSSNALERQPPVLALDDDLERRAEPRVGVHDPREGVRVDRAGTRRGVLAPPLPQLARAAAASPLPSSWSACAIMASHAGGSPSATGCSLPAKTRRRVASASINRP